MTKLHRNSHTPALINEQEAFLKEGDVLKKISGKKIRYSGKLPSVIHTWNAEAEQYYKSISFSYGNGMCLEETVTPPSVFAEVAPGEVQDENAQEAGQAASRPESENFYTSYLWGYENNYPVAKAENARNNQVAYTSFETPDAGNWRYNQEGVSQTGESGRGRVFQGELRWSSVTAGKYKITFWAKGSGTVSLTYPAGNSLENKYFTASDSWEPVEWVIDLEESKGLLINSGAALIDDVRLHPVSATMGTYTYEPGVGISSQADGNLKATFYEYDRHNRLKRIKDHEGNILEEYTYHYMR